MCITKHIKYVFIPFDKKGQEPCYGCMAIDGCTHKFRQACKGGKRGIFDISYTEYRMEMTAKERLDYNKE